MFNVNGDSLPGPLIIGTFEQRAPGPEFGASSQKEFQHCLHESAPW